MTEDVATYRYPDEDSGTQVLSVGDADQPRTVVLLHELGGLARSTMDFAMFLRDEGDCAVHMPVLFGRPGQDNPALGLAQLCWGRQLVLLLGDRRSKVADWLVRFCRHVNGSNPHGVTVIGMCATGGLVFSVLADASVAAGVSAQPSLPLRPTRAGHNIRTLGASAADVQDAAASGKPFKAIAYGNDWRCPAGRLNQIGEVFPGAVLEIDGSGHSTLVYQPADDARTAVLRLLDEAYG